MIEFMKQVLPRLERPQSPGCALSLCPPSPYEPKLYRVLMAADGPGVSFSTAPVVVVGAAAEATGGGSGGAAGADEEMLAFSVAVTTLFTPGEDSFLVLEKEFMNGKNDGK